MSGTLDVTDSYTIFEGAMSFSAINMFMAHLGRTGAASGMPLGPSQTESDSLRVCHGKGSFRHISPIFPVSGAGQKTVLLLVTILLMAISLAGPQYGYSWKEIERRGVDLMLVLDCSRSMLAEDIRPSRLERAKREVFDLLSMLQGDRVGLVAFAGTAFLQCPLTLDYEGFHLFLDALNPGFLLRWVAPIWPAP